MGRIHTRIVTSSAIRLVVALLLIGGGSTVRAASFVNFETGQVRPLAMSPDGTRLFAVNTPDNRLEVFTLDANGLTHAASVPVGLEPIAVAARTDAEVWVVNHLSDSISIVDVSSSPPHITRTLLTCDEPRDIVFAGPTGRAYVTTARRGQNCPVNDQPTTAGIGRALVQVWDPASIDNTLAGTPINIVLFGDTPRALARSADGNTVYAAIFHSGNQTTSLQEPTVCDGGADASPCGAFLQFPGGLPAPNVNIENLPGPEVGLIVKFNPATGKWEDTLARDWSAAVRFDLPDLDVFAIDAVAGTPVETANFAHVGTVLFNMVANPVSGHVYVSNTEARNEVRFEGPGLAFNSTTVQGHLHEARITVLDGANVEPHHLNPHIDYDQRPAPAGVKEKSLATPVGMAVSANGATLWVAAFGSSKIGVVDTAALEAGSLVPDTDDHITLTGGGPTGLVLDEARDRLYVLTRFDNSVSVVKLSTREEEAHVALFDPEPASIAGGRSFLYDAAHTSSNGEASCSSCHVFGDLDSLGWDLGNPDDVQITNPIPTKIPAIPPTFPDFHPLKGPMTTQSLRGMANNGSMHWRGDRTGGNDPGGDSFDEDAAFKKFNVAFPGLIGRDSELPVAEMQAFTDFMLSVTYPPNPIRRFDGTFTAAQQAGHDLYFGRNTDVVFNCNGCHTLDPGIGAFGTDGFSTFEGETQMFKVPHLRNAYQKVGMFGRPSDAPRGPQIRGFGFLHDGSIDTIRRFLGAGVFDLTNAEQNDLERFVLAFDTDLAPIVGQQITLRPGAGTNVGTRIDLMYARADLFECEIVVKGTIVGEQRGGFRLGDGTFQMDRLAETKTDAELRTIAATAGQELTWTCVPPGSGERMGIDRDEDGFFDHDELDLNSDPADHVSIPATRVRASVLRLRDSTVAGRQRLVFRSTSYRGAPSGIVLPVPGDGSDPALHGARVTVFGGGGSSVIDLPASRWSQSGSASSPRWLYRDAQRLDSPISKVSIRENRLIVRGRGETLYSLASAPQGTVAIRLKLGTGIEFCAAAPAKSPATSNDTTVKFTGERNTPPPAVCPLVP